MRKAPTVANKTKARPLNDADTFAFFTWCVSITALQARAYAADGRIAPELGESLLALQLLMEQDLHAAGKQGIKPTLALPPVPSLHELVHSDIASRALAAYKPGPGQAERGASRIPVDNQSRAKMSPTNTRARGRSIK